MPSRTACRDGPRDPRELGSAWTRFQHHSFPAPSPDLAAFVERYWIVEWSYDEPYRQLIVPLPNVHLTFHQDRPAEVHGASRGHGVKELSGTGRVVGVAFRPGGFRPFLRSSVSALTDRTVPVADIGLPPAPASPDVAAVEEWLRAARPEADPMSRWVGGVVELVAGEPGIARVDQLASRCGTGVRRLQRLFAEYVGLGPKWVIRRYRLHEATERMAGGDPVDWAGLAAELGYADQPHFVRDFTTMFGEPPTHYSQRY